MQSQTERQSRLFGIAAFLGTMLFIPVWDLYALFYTVRTGLAFRADDDRRKEALDTLIHPLRRLAILGLGYLFAMVGFQFLGNLIRQPGPFGFLTTGMLNMQDWAITNGIVSEAACCENSMVISPARTVADILAFQVPTTLSLLAMASVMAMVLTALMVAVALWLRGLSERQYVTGTVISGILKLGAFRALAAPTFSLSLMAIAFLSIRFQWFPMGALGSFEPEGSVLADRIWHLILPGFALAALPSLITTVAGLRAWSTWRESGRDEAGRWGMLGLELARAFYDHAGWLIGGVIIIEMIFGLPGVGNLLQQAIIQSDPPLVLAVLAIFPLWVLVARARMIINDSAQRAYMMRFPEKDVAKPTPQTEGEGDLRALMPKVWLALAGLVAVWLIGMNIVGSTRTAFNPYEFEGDSDYLPPTAEHPRGTDRQGRDIQARLMVGQRITFAIVVQAGLIAFVFGGAYGAASTALRGWRGQTGMTIADIIRIPPEAAILLHPALVALAFTVARSTRPVPDGPPGQSLSAMAYMIGMVLVPRIAWGFESLWDNLPKDRSTRFRLVGVMVVLLCTVLFAAFQYTTAISFMQLGVQAPRPSVGNLLGNYGEVIAGILSAGDARFYVLLTGLATAAGLQSFAFFLLQDSVTDFFGIRRKSFLPKLFS